MMFNVCFGAAPSLHHADDSYRITPARHLLRAPPAHIKGGWRKRTPPTHAVKLAHPIPTTPNRVRGR